jgi:hypothetical protein
LKIVFEVEKSNLQKVKDKLLKDDVVGRASITFKEGTSLDLKDRYYFYISGTEETIKRSEELMEDLGKKADEKTKEQVL